jgi:hypothetical protein
MNAGDLSVGHLVGVGRPAPSATRSPRRPHGDVYTFAIRDVAHSSFQLRRANHPTGLLLEQMAKDVEGFGASIAHVHEASPFRRATGAIHHTPPDIRLAFELRFHR